MDYNEFIKTSDLSKYRWKEWIVNGLPRESDTMVRSCKVYRFPWYLGHMWLWHGLVCWWKTGKWPVSILRFKNVEEKKLYLRVLRENGLLQ